MYSNAERNCVFFSINLLRQKVPKEIDNLFVHGSSVDAVQPFFFVFSQVFLDEIVIFIYVNLYSILLKFNTINEIARILDVFSGEFQKKNEESNCHGPQGYPAKRSPQTIKYLNYRRLITFWALLA